MRCLLLLMLLLSVGCKREAAPSSKQIVRLAATEPQSLDPRLARTLADASYSKALYEGLMRIDLEGKLANGMAEKVAISDDGLTYTFALRHATWSNGDPVTSYDFADSWRCMLTPNYPSPNAFQLYPIKNARLVKAGELPIDQLKIETPDAKTLVVQLEDPTPYFLELTTLYAMSPVNFRQLEASNGPFKRLINNRRDGVVFARNPAYWDAPSVKLDEIHFLFVDDATAFGMLRTGQLDLAGSPFGILPADAIAALQEEVICVNCAATHWLRFNTDKLDLNLRRALTLAIDRQALIAHVIQGNQLPALGLIPTFTYWQANSYFQDGDLQAAKEALHKAGKTPKLVLTYGQNERNHRLAQALQEQWRSHLGIKVELEAMEFILATQKVKAMDYQIAIGSWFADFRDPINFLSAFEGRNNGLNHTGWEKPEYKALLAASYRAKEEGEREALLKNAEQILLQDYVVAPLFFYRLNYMKQPQLHGVSISELGTISFRDAYFE